MKKYAQDLRESFKTFADGADYMKKTAGINTLFLVYVSGHDIELPDKKLVLASTKTDYRTLFIEQIQTKKEIVFDAMNKFEEIHSQLKIKKYSDATSILIEFGILASFITSYRSLHLQDNHDWLIISGNR